MIPTTEALKELEKRLGCNPASYEDFCCSHERKFSDCLKQECLRLQTEVAKEKAKNRLHENAVNRWLPCPDHRDKVSGGCYVCRNEKLQTEVGRLRNILRAWTISIINGDTCTCKLCEAEWDVIDGVETHQEWCLNEK